MPDGAAQLHQAIFDLATAMQASPHSNEEGGNGDGGGD
jgi:hypothetical protein